MKMIFNKWSLLIVGIIFIVIGSLIKIPEYDSSNYIVTSDLIKTLAIGLGVGIFTSASVAFYVEKISINNLKNKSINKFAKKILLFFISEIYKMTYFDFHNEGYEKQAKKFSLKSISDYLKENLDRWGNMYSDSISDFSNYSKKVDFENILKKSNEFSKILYDELICDATYDNYSLFGEKISNDDKNEIVVFINLLSYYIDCFENKIFEYYFDNLKNLIIESEDFLKIFNNLDDYKSKDIVILSYFKKDD